MKILVTGAAGFIGFHLSLWLLARGDEVVGLDNMNPYYDVRLKASRLKQLTSHPMFRFVEADIINRPEMERLFQEGHFDRVFHLAAQAGVRYSIENPHVYIESNLVGFIHILEGCRHHAIPHLIYASSSSVYGANTKMPFSVSDNVDHPISLYAATKKANELMAYTYSHLYRIPTTGLRFFTVYGPWGRPDMALFKFTKAIIAGQPIDIYNHGEMQRDFTYIDDIIEGVIRVSEKIPTPKRPEDNDLPHIAPSTAPYRIFNIGSHHPVPLLRLIEILEQLLGKKAQRNLLPMQAGDVPATYADVDDLISTIGYKPSTPIEEGVKRFINWYRNHYPAQNN